MQITGCVKKDYGTRSPQRSKRHWLSWIPAFAFLVFGATAFALPLAAPKTGEMAVVFLPNVSESEAHRLVASAGGSIVGPTRINNIVVAYATDPDFQNRMIERGAILFLAATGLCSNTQT
jgi:anti-sigma factor RsiW